jgi:geranylgeranyl diphosphate synthase type II
MIGAIAAGVDPPRLVQLRKFAALLGIAFQIQDDILNVVGEGDRYGKEIGGDLWEGKRTLLLMHALRSASTHERKVAERTLAKRRPTMGSGEQRSPDADSAFHRLLSRLEDSGDISAMARRAISRQRSAPSRSLRSTADVRFLAELIRRHGSVGYASAVATRFAELADAALRRIEGLLPSVHSRFLEDLVRFVIRRDH